MCSPSSLFYSSYLVNVFAVKQRQSAYNLISFMPVSSLVTIAFSELTGLSKLIVKSLNSLKLIVKSLNSLMRGNFMEQWKVIYAFSSVSWVLVLEIVVSPKSEE